MEPRCVLAVNWLLFRVGLRVSRNLCELGPAQFVGAFLFIFNGPWCFAARTYSSSFSQYLGSRGSLAEYETVSFFRQFLITTPRSSLAHLLAAVERLSTFEESYFLG